MTLDSLHLAALRPDHARAATPRGACTAGEGLDAETFRGFQLAGELFLLTSFFIELEGDACVRNLGRQVFSPVLCLNLRVNGQSVQNGLNSPFSKTERENRRRPGAKSGASRPSPSPTQLLI